MATATRPTPTPGQAAQVKVRTQGPGIPNDSGKRESEIPGVNGGPVGSTRPRRIIGYPTVIPPVLPDGRIPVERVLGRFNQLVQTTGAEVNGFLIVRYSDARVGMTIKNNGPDIAYISHVPVVSANRDFPLAAGEVRTYLYPTCPMNNLYAASAGATGGDLRITEIVYERPESWVADVDEGTV